MNEIDANQLLLQMKILAAQARNSEVPSTENTVQGEFGSLLKTAIDKVSDYQAQASELSNRFEAGDESVSLTQVMIAMQKSTVSLQTMTQVRNKLVNAYQEIMNMPI